MLNTHLTPESKVLDFGFEVTHVSDLRTIYSKEKE